MDYSAILTVICATGLPTIGAGIAWMWKKIEDRRKAMEDAFNIELTKCRNELQAEVDRCELARKDTEKARQDEETARKDVSARLIAIEALINGDMPKWVRNQDGLIQSVSSEFLRIFAAPRGYRQSMIVGKKFSQLVAFSTELVDVLENMEREVLIKKYSHRTGVDAGFGVLATIIMTTISSGTGDVMFVGYAVPE